LDARGRQVDQVLVRGGVPDGNSAACAGYPAELCKGSEGQYEMVRTDEYALDVR
jgi:hypothetical protein